MTSTFDQANVHRRLCNDICCLIILILFFLHLTRSSIIFYPNITHPLDSFLWHAIESIVNIEIISKRFCFATHSHNTIFFSMKWTDNLLRPEVMHTLPCFNKALCFCKQYFSQLNYTSTIPAMQEREKNDCFNWNHNDQLVDIKTKNRLGVISWYSNQFSLVVRSFVLWSTFDIIFFVDWSQASIANLDWHNGCSSLIFLRASFFSYHYTNDFSLNCD